MSAPIVLTDVERERIIAARAWVHATTCPRAGYGDGPCPACPSPLGTYRALLVLDERPRDARAARRALHDAVCASALDGGCGPDSDHADRTQARTAAALRKYLAQADAA